MTTRRLDPNFNPNPNHRATNFYRSTYSRKEKRASWDRLLTLHAGLTRFIQGFDINFNRADEGLIIDLTPKSNPAVDYALLSDHIGKPPFGQTLLGWGDHQQPVFIDLSGNQPSHLLIASHHSSGKTALLRTILFDMARRHKPAQRQFVICAGFGIPPVGKGESGLSLFDQLPHVLGMSSNNIQAAAELIHFVKDELAHRQQVQTQFPIIYTVIDNVQDIIKLCGTETLNDLIALAASGPEFGIKLILSTNRPEDSRIQDILDAGDFLRIVGQVSDVTMSEIATSRLEAGAETFRRKGQFVLVKGDRLEYFMAAFAEEPHLRHQLDRIAHQKGPILLAQSYVDDQFTVVEPLNTRRSTEIVEEEPESKPSYLRPSTLRSLRPIEPEPETEPEHRAENDAYDSEPETKEEEEIFPEIEIVQPTPAIVMAEEVEVFEAFEELEQVEIEEEDSVTAVHRFFGIPLHKTEIVIPTKQEDLPVPIPFQPEVELKIEDQYEAVEEIIELEIEHETEEDFEPECLEPEDSEQADQLLTFSSETIANESQDEYQVQDEDLDDDPWNSGFIDEESEPEQTDQEAHRDRRRLSKFRTKRSFKKKFQNGKEHTGETNE